MRMLNALKQCLPDIEIVDVYAYNFILSIILQKELNPSLKLTGKQFSYLVRLQNRFCTKNKMVTT